MLNPLGVPSRMNVGQILETHLGWAGGEAGLPGRDPGVRRRDRDGDPRGPGRGRPARDRQDPLYDGRTGEPFEQLVDRRLHLHAEAAPPGGQQGPRPLDRPVLADHAAAAGRQGAVRRPAFRRNGSVGPGGVRRRPTSCRSSSRSRATTWKGGRKSTSRWSRERTRWRRARPASFDVLTNEIRGLGLNMQLEKARA